MSGLNKVMLIGNLGAEPESKTLGSGSQVCNFRIATSETWKDKDGKKQERTEWHRITAWGKLAEICSSYLHKGSKVYVEGRIQTDEYEKDGEKRFSTNIVISDMTMLDSKKGESSSAAPVDENAPF